MEKKTNEMQDLLLDIIEFVGFQVKTGKCTKETIDKWASVVSEELETLARTKNIADFYGESESNVRNILARRYIPKEHKPKRKVYFSFNLFAKLKPKSWKRKDA